MAKIVDFNSLKKNDTKEMHICEIKSNDVFNLLDEKKYDEALELSEKHFQEYKYVEAICECYIASIVVNFDKFSDEDFEKYYFIFKDIYYRYLDNQFISRQAITFYLYFIDSIKKLEVEDFDYFKFFNDIYNRFPNSNSISYLYSSALLLNVDNLLETNTEEHKAIFDKTIDVYIQIMLNFDDDEIIATDFAKFLYLASVRANNDTITKIADKLLVDLKIDFEDCEEVLTYYCFFIAHFYINDTSLRSMKAVNEFKEIIANNESYVFREIFFLALYNLVSGEPYSECKSLIRQMRSIIYSLDKESEEFENLSELFAETLSNCSCDQQITAITINDEILPLISSLIKDFGNNENIIMEYSIILYNIFCLINFYEGDDAPHIDVFNELKNCAEHFDVAVPYYCLCLSNLIHLSTEEKSLEYVATIKECLDEFNDLNMPTTKNMYTLKTIYAISLANLVNLVDETKCEDEILKIKFLLDGSNTLDLNLVEGAFDSQILPQYVRALTYYLEKENLSDDKKEIIRYILSEIKE